MRDLWCSHIAGITPIFGAASNLNVDRSILRKLDSPYQAALRCALLPVSGHNITRLFPYQTQPDVCAAKRDKAPVLWEKFLRGLQLQVVLLWEMT